MIAKEMNNTITLYVFVVESSGLNRIGIIPIVMEKAESITSKIAISQSIVLRYLRVNSLLCQTVIFLFTRKHSFDVAVSLIHIVNLHIAKCL